MKKSFEIKQRFQVKPAIIYKAWLDSETHTNMTGGEANCSNQVGSKFTAWDGYISGTNVELIPNMGIKQTWRTTEFDENDADSLLTITLNDTNEGCELYLVHTNIPEGEANYEKGWQEHYFAPMKKYFK